MLEFLTLPEKITVANHSFMDFYPTRSVTGVKVVWIRKKKRASTYFYVFGHLSKVHRWENQDCDPGWRKKVGCLIFIKVNYELFLLFDNLSIQLDCRNFRR